MPSQKRKAGEPALQKFYAVRAGKKPGVYLLWPECQAQIAGFKGAQFKSFTTREDAAAFVAGRIPPTELQRAAREDKKPDKFYAVAKGPKPGIYTEWAEASVAITGTKGPKYKKFATRGEAEAFIREFGDADVVQEMEAAVREERRMLGLEEDNADFEDEEELAMQPAAKKSRISTTATTQVAPKAAPPAGKDGDVTHIYTDGSSRGNGRAGAMAGVGVFFGQGDARNISERLRGEPQTNQRAELTAILRALEVVPTKQGVHIFSDSKYSIQCVTEWYRSWLRNGWRTSAGPVKNRDLVEAVRARIDERDKKGVATLFTWVKGHAADAGNVAADGLAVQGAMKPLPA